MSSVAVATKLGPALSPEQVEEGLTLARSGLSLPEIARRLGVSRGVAQGWLIQSGLLPTSTPREFHAGDAVGGVEILRLLNAPVLLSRRLYRVRYLCCGRIAEMSHPALRQRALRTLTRCRLCRSKPIATACLVDAATREAALLLAVSRAWRMPT